jgi:hypothetical protein
MLTAESIKQMYKTPWYDSEATYIPLNKGITIGTKEWFDCEIDAIKTLLEVFSKHKVKNQMIQRLKKHLKSIKNKDGLTLDEMLETRAIYKDSKTILFKLKKENPSEDVLTAIKAASVPQARITKKINTM